MKKKSTNLTIREKQILNELEKSIKWVNLHQQGKVKAKTIEQFLNEL
jgi:hypothetical protein